jgi:hypothetical protein
LARCLDQRLLSLVLIDLLDFLRALPEKEIGADRRTENRNDCCESPGTGNAWNDETFCYVAPLTPEALRRRPVRAFHDWLFEEFKVKSRGDAADEVSPVRHAAILV